MNITIGSRIKQLRKEKHITQEQLSQSLGISFQAISKWGNGIGFPDITIIPQIAGFFSVTIDDLFGYNLEEMNKEIEQICAESCKYRESNLEKGCKILEEGLKKYPDNDLILCHLLYVQNYSKNPDNVIKTAFKLLEVSDDVELRYDTYRFLAYAYHQKGDDKAAAEALDNIPELYFTALTEKAYLFSGEKKFDAAQKQKWVSFEHLIEMMYKITEFYRDNGDTKSAITELETAIKVMETFSYDSKIDNFMNYKNLFEKQLAKLKS